MLSIYCSWNPPLLLAPGPSQAFPQMFWRSKLSKEIATDLSLQTVCTPFGLFASLKQFEAKKSSAVGSPGQHNDPDCKHGYYFYSTGKGERECEWEERDSELGTGAVESGRAGGWVWMKMAMPLGVRERLWAHPVIQSSPSRSTVALPFCLLPFSIASPHLD